jgi:hypothetical protein
MLDSPRSVDFGLLYSIDNTGETSIYTKSIYRPFSTLKMPAVLLLVALGYLLLYAFATPHVSAVSVPLPDSSWMNVQNIEGLALFESTARHAMSEYMHHVFAG